MGSLIHWAVSHRLTYVSCCLRHSDEGTAQQTNTVFFIEDGSPSINLWMAFFSTGTIPMYSKPVEPTDKHWLGNQITEAQTKTDQGTHTTSFLFLVGPTVFPLMIPVIMMIIKSELMLKTSLKTKVSLLVFTFPKVINLRIFSSIQIHHSSLVWGI